MSDKHTRWVIEATSNLDSVSIDLERIIALQKKQIEVTQAQNSESLKAMLGQKTAIEGVTAALQKQVTTTTTGTTQQKTSLGLLKNEYDNLGKTITGITQLLAGAFIVSEIKNYIDGVIKAKSAQDLFAVSLENMLGSKVKADAINAQLMAIAIKSPFEVEQIQQVTTRLVAMGVSVQEIIPYINMLGDISAVVGTSKLPLIAKALLDVKNKGVLMKQELNQFAENGVPLYDLLAASMGKTRDEVVKLAEAHKITFKDVELALKNATSEGGRYYGQMAAQSQTLAGQVANLSDQYTLAKAAVGDFFEGEIKGGIATMQSLIHETIGSQAAIARMVDGVKAATAAYVTYRLAIITLNSAKKAAAETVALTATEAGASVATGGLTVAWNALKVAFVTNPIGILITAVGALVTAFYSYKAIMADVTDEQNLQSDALRKSNKEVEIAIKATMQHKEGTDEYKKSVQGLIDKWPEYFIGLTAETANNRKLNGALMEINESFQERIRLANLAYKADALTQKAIDLDRQQLEVISKLRKEYAALSSDYINDESFIAALKKQRIFADNYQTTPMASGAFNTSQAIFNNSDIIDAENFISKKRAIEKELVQIKQASEKEQTIITARELDQQMRLLIKQLNDKEITQKEFNDKVKILKGEEVKTHAAGEDEKDKKSKSSLEYKLENQLKELKAVEQTFWTKQDILDAEEKLDIERAKRQIKNKTDEAERILSIEKEYDLKRQKLLQSSIDYKMVDLKKLQENSDKEFKIRNTLAEDIEDLTLYMNGLILKEEEEKAQRIIELGKEIFETQKDLQQATIRLGELNAVKDAKIWQDKALIAEKYYRDILADALEAAQKQEAIAQAQYDHYLKVFGPGNELTMMALANLNKAKTAATNALGEVEENAKKITEITIDDIIKIGQAALSIITKLVENYTESTRMAADSLDTVAGIIDDFTKKNRDALQEQLSDVTLTNEQREAAIDASLNRETELVKRKSAMLAMRDQLTDLAERTESTMGIVQSGLNAVVSFAKGDFVGGIIGVVETINGLFNRSAMLQIQQEMSVLREKQRSAQEKMQLIEAEVAARQEALNAELAALDAEMTAFRAAQAEKKAALEQASSDSQLRLQEDQNFRNRLLAEGEAREIAMLEAARAREIAAAQARNATAEEVADIQNAFNALVALKHQEYEDAKADKTKQVSLATQEVKAQETDKVNALKEAEGQKAAEVEAQKKAATDDFRNFAQGAQAQIFEQQKQLAILEIRMEIAKLRAQKRKWFSSKKALNAAISEMEAIINDITGGGVDVADDWGGSGGDGTTGEGSGGEGDSKREGKFHGDTFLKRSGKQPYGLDTIPIMAHVGERIMQAYINAKLGPDVSNEELADGYLQYQKLMDKIPDLSLHVNAAGKLNVPVKTLHVPAMNPTSSMEAINRELQNEIRGLRKALSNRGVQVIVNAQGVSDVTQISAEQKRVYYQNMNS